MSSKLLGLPALAVPLLGLALLLAGCQVGAPSAEVAGGELAHALRALVAKLDPEQRKLAVRPIEDEEASKWHFVPGRYPGLELGALQPAQKACLHDVLRTMLSATGFAKTMAITDLESVLHKMESKPGKPASHRDPDRYSLLLCGRPEHGGTFVVRFQGHHVSLRMAVVDGMLVSHTPHFLGSNPHVIPESFARPTVLRQEEQLGRELLAMFDADQRAQAIISDTAPPDVLLGPGKAPELLGERRGLPVKSMRDDQRAKLWQLLEVYAHVLRCDVASQELDRIARTDYEELSFAWAGSSEPSEPHYYRLHGVRFAIEYDCTQNDANHVHVVWRDFDRDFGGDALRLHLAEQHTADVGN